MAEDERVAALKDKLEQYGVVGAGGAGFPTHVKADSTVGLTIANGAECELLVHKDLELMKNFPAEIVAGMKLMMEATHARRGVFGVKEKNADAIDAIRPHLHGSPIEMVLLGDFYPSGDEFELVYIATGRLIPPAGIPLQVGAVVNNVETLYNIHQASRDVPVTRKLISVTGEVNEPKSVRVPIGTSFRNVLELAGGATVSDFAILVSGIMMGTVSFDLDDQVTKTTAGLIVLSRYHPLVVRKSQPNESMKRIGRSACDQCSYCTELCPRYLLGYEVMPHKVMRSLGFSLTGAANWNRWAQLCCACGLCTLYACPESLYPKEACDQAKRDLRSAGLDFLQKSQPQPHPMKEDRRIPLSQLRKRLRVEEYEREAPFDDRDFTPRSVKINLAQHMGSPARPLVRQGDTVSTGELIAAVKLSELGANVHSSICGKVESVGDGSIEIVGDG